MYWFIDMLITNVCCLQVIVKDKCGNITLYCKGADSTVYERLGSDCGDLQETTTLHLEVGIRPPTVPIECWHGGPLDWHLAQCLSEAQCCRVTRCCQKPLLDPGFPTTRNVVVLVGVLVVVRFSNCLNFSFPRTSAADW